ncbi:hypothetical protein J113_08915 [Mycobacterium tuberculosis CAS/NITR204]|uniref:Phosphoglycerate mutase n=1 Tax=Mycobacterium tuberculosis CAS/NITR204 TaxID=1310114 RepID=R4M534_MYCTX|nr:hypothetical protein J113_08915 [Mycobacterium tuberculosis CAS/NITR204]
MNEQYRNLVLMRHAKSAYPDGIADHDRPLAPRGIREAGLAGGWLRANLPAVDAVLCSTAARGGRGAHRHRRTRSLRRAALRRGTRNSDRGDQPGWRQRHHTACGRARANDVGPCHRPGQHQRHRRRCRGTHLGEVPDVGDRRATRRRTLGRRRTGVCRAGRLSRATVEVLLLRKPSAAYFLLKAAEPASARVCTPTRR